MNGIFSFENVKDDQSINTFMHLPNNSMTQSFFSSFCFTVRDAAIKKKYFP